MATETEILGMVYEVIREFNAQLSPESRLGCSPDTVLVGEAGVLDSLGLINLLVILEDALNERLERRVLLLDEQLIREDGPFRTVGALARYVLTLPPGTT